MPSSFLQGKIFKAITKIGHLYPQVAIGTHIVKCTQKLLFVHVFCIILIQLTNGNN